MVGRKKNGARAPLHPSMGALSNKLRYHRCQLATICMLSLIYISILLTHTYTHTERERERERVRDERRIENNDEEKGERERHLVATVHIRSLEFFTSGILVQIFDDKNHP